jgi:hypothetical protein
MELTHEEKVQYLRIAMNLQDFGINTRSADQLVVSFEKILELGGDFSLRDAVKIETDIILKYETKIKEEAK